MNHLTIQNYISELRDTYNTLITSAVLDILTTQKEYRGGLIAAATKIVGMRNAKRADIEPYLQIVGDLVKKTTSMIEKQRLPIAIIQRGPIFHKCETCPFSITNERFLETGQCCACINARRVVEKVPEWVPKWMP